MNTPNKLRLGKALACIALAGLGLAGTAEAGTTIPTEITVDGIDCMGSPTGPCLASGWIESPRGRCLEGRKVKLFIIYSDRDPFLFDVAATGRGGGFGAFGEIPDGDTQAIRARVTKKKFGRRGHRKTCAPATFT